MDKIDGLERINTNEKAAIKKPEPPRIIRKIGRTTYEVSIHFSETSTESMSDKIKRLIGRDCENLQVHKE